MKKKLRMRKRSYAAPFAALAAIVWLLFLAIAHLSGGEDRLADRYVMPVDDPKRLKENIPSNGTAIVFFKSRNCPICAALEPHLLRYANEGNAVVLVATIEEMMATDRTEASRILREYGVRGTPTLVLYHDGKKLSTHEGDFRGDRYEGLKSWVSGHVDGARAPPVRAESVEQGAPIWAPLLLGLAGALSPCSLPMIAVYASSSRKVSAGALASKLMVLLITVAGGALALAALYLVSPSLPLNVYGIAISLLASALIAWGLLTLWTRDPALFAFEGLTRFAPLLGVQCSMPFLVASLTMISVSTLTAIIGSALFAIGYSAPYALAGAISGLAGGLERVMSSRLALVAQGLVLIGAGAYVLYTLYPDFRLLG